MSKRKRRSEVPIEEIEPTEVVNGQVVTEDALKKIGRNVLKALGVGVEERLSKSKLLPRHVRKAIKTCQVIS